MGDFSFKTYLDAWNSHDASQVVALMTDDVLFEDVPMSVRCEGKDAVAFVVAETAKLSDDFRFECVTEIRGDSDYAGEWILSGTNTGEGAGLSATGKSLTIRGLSIGHLAPDARILARRDDWDIG